MSVMIVGADSLGNIEKNLREYGINTIEHLSCRNAAARRRFSISNATSLIVVLTDFINHATAKNIKEQAKSQGVPTIFSRRSWCALEEQLAKHGISKIDTCSECMKKAGSNNCPKVIRH